VTEYIIGDLRTGRRLSAVRVTKGPWAVGIGGPGTVSVTVSLADPDIRALDLRSAASVGKAYLAVVENDTILEAGPIWTHNYRKSDRTLQLNAAGLWTYFDHRVLMRMLAAGEVPQDGDTYLENLSWGTIAKRLVQQARTFTGAEIPIVFQPDEAGGVTATYSGADLRLVGDALQDIAAQDGGPEIEFTPEWTDDRKGIHWRLRTGTTAQPQLASKTTHRFDYSVEKRTVSDLEVAVDGSKLVGRGWTTGGRSSSVALFGQHINTALTDRGYPFLEVVDSSHSTAETQEDVDGFAKELARVGSKPTEFWTFKARADAVPLAGSYRPGDSCSVHMANDDYIPDGDYARRITDIAGDEQGDWIKVTTGEVYSLAG
jgi:hypothetical protein